MNDDLRDVAIALRIAGAQQKPSRIYSDLTEGWIDKYVEEFDFLVELIKHGQSLFMLQAYIKDIKKLSHKFNFSITHETRIGAINPNYKPKGKEVHIIEIENNSSVVQMTFYDLGW